MSSASADRRLYLALAVGLLLTVLWGFWASYFGPLLQGARVQRHWLIHLHVAVFALWVILIVAQALLVTSGHVHAHRRLGVAAGVYGAVVFAVGLVVSIGVPVMRVHAGQLEAEMAALVALFNLTDMLLFGSFFAAALLYRGRPELHRRLIVSASVALAGAAVGRVIRGESLLYLAVWLWPLLALIAFDLWQRRRVHFLSVLSVALFTTAFFKVQIYSSSALCRRLGSALLAPFL